MRRLALVALAIHGAAAAARGDVPQGSPAEAFRAALDALAAEEMSAPGIAAEDLAAFGAERDAIVDKGKRLIEKLQRLREASGEVDREIERTQEELEKAETPLPPLTEAERRDLSATDFESLEQALRKLAIRIPYPQRDVHIVTPSPTLDERRT